MLLFYLFVKLVILLYERTIARWELIAATQFNTNAVITDLSYCYVRKFLFNNNNYYYYKYTLFHI